LEIEGIENEVIEAFGERILTMCFSEFGKVQA
jgi:hypothetical protein